MNDRDSLISVECSLLGTEDFLILKKFNLFFSKGRFDENLDWRKVDLSRGE